VLGLGRISYSIRSRVSKSYLFLIFWFKYFERFTTCVYNSLILASCPLHIFLEAMRSALVLVSSCLLLQYFWLIYSMTLSNLSFSSFNTSFASTHESNSSLNLTFYLSMASIFLVFSYFNMVSWTPLAFLIICYYSECSSFKTLNLVYEIESYFFFLLYLREVVGAVFVWQSEFYSVNYLFSDLADICDIFVLNCTWTPSFESLRAKS
jgi:hypothetical protein